MLDTSLVAAAEHGPALRVLVASRALGPRLELTPPLLVKRNSEGLGSRRRSTLISRLGTGKATGVS